MVISIRFYYQFYISVSYLSFLDCNSMPISSPPQNYALEPAGTSGIPVGPDVVIVDDSMVTVVARGVKGNILIRGAPCFGNL